MAPELTGILTVGVALAALILTSTGRLRKDLGAQIEALEARLGTRLAALETRLESLETRMESLETRMESLEARLAALETRLGSLETRVGSLEQRMARLEGLLEGAGLYRPAAEPESRPAPPAQPVAGD